MNCGRAHDYKVQTLDRSKTELHIMCYIFIYKIAVSFGRDIGKQKSAKVIAIRKLKQIKYFQFCFGLIRCTRSQTRAIGFFSSFVMMLVIKIDLSSYLD